MPRGTTNKTIGKRTTTTSRNLKNGPTGGTGNNSPQIWPKIEKLFQKQHDGLMSGLKGIFATAGQNTGRRTAQAAGKAKMRATGGLGQQQRTGTSG